MKNPSLKNSYNKVISVIESCKTKEQLSGAYYMINNFKKLYKNVGYPKVLSYNLNRKLEQQLLKSFIIAFIP